MISGGSVADATTSFDLQTSVRNPQNGWYCGTFFGEPIPGSGSSSGRDRLRMALIRKRRRHSEAISALPPKVIGIWESADVTSQFQTKNVTIPDSYPGAPKPQVLQWCLSQQNSIADDGVTLTNIGSSATRNPITSIDQQPVTAIALNSTDSIASKDSVLLFADALSYVQILGP